MPNATLARPYARSENVTVRKSNFERYDSHTESWGMTTGLLARPHTGGGKCMDGVRDGRPGKQTDRQDNLCYPSVNPSGEPTIEARDLSKREEHD